MAETTKKLAGTSVAKLAGQFRAWRLMIAVDPENFCGAINRCEELGLPPKVCGHRREGKSIKICFFVAVPCSGEEKPESSVCWEQLGPFNVSLLHITIVAMICPPPPVSESRMCPECRATFHHLSPLSPELPKHNVGDESGSIVCPGSGKQGSVI